MVSNASYGSGRKTNPRRDLSIGIVAELAAGNKGDQRVVYMGVRASVALVKLWPGSRGTLGIERSLAAGKTIMLIG